MQHGTESITSPKQKRLPLPSLMSFSSSMDYSSDKCSRLLRQWSRVRIQHRVITPIGGKALLSSLKFEPFADLFLALGIACEYIYTVYKGIKGEGVVIFL